MNVFVDKSFQKDLQKIKDPKLRKRIASIMETLIKAQKLEDVNQVKKLKGGDIFYRIKIQEYRLGFNYENKAITLVRFLHRKDIYHTFQNKPASSVPDW